jgi:subtilisin family serine protease
MLSARAARTVLTGAAALLTALVLSVTAGAGVASADAVRQAQLWVLNAIDAPAAWRVTEGQGVTVAVIDSGVNPNVSDLTGSVITGPDYTGVDTPESSPDWGIHGTWMASLIAGHGHDGGGSGILGAAPKSRVLSIRVITDRADPKFEEYEHESANHIQRELARAIRYATSHGASVISMSLGYGAASLPVRSALQNALNHNVVVVASSGNSGSTSAARARGYAPYSFPADYPGVLGVAAVNENDRPASFSSDNLSVQVAAPGVRVPAQGNDGQYWLVSGTSPACALTAGVAALIKSVYPHMSPALVREAITTTTHNRPPGGYNDRVGFGTVDAAAALAAAARLSSRSDPSGGRTGARDRSGERPASADGINTASHFGGGPSAVPPAPVGPRGPGQLILFCLLGVGCLAVTVTTASRLMISRRQAASALAAPPRPYRNGYRPDGYPPDPGGFPAQQSPWSTSSGGPTSGRHAAPPDWPPGRPYE